MTQAYLDFIKEIGAQIAIQYTNGHVDARLRGTGQEGEIFDHCLRVHWLWGAIKEAHLSGAVLYVGSEIMDDADLTSIYHKLWHYNGIYADVDLSDYPDITPDDGDGGDNGEQGDEGGGTGGDGGSTVVDTDHYRADTVIVVPGTNTVTFSSPLPSTDYRIIVYVDSYTGYQQRNLVVGTKTAQGFTVTDVLEAGVLTYFCVIDL